MKKEKKIKEKKIKEKKSFKSRLIKTGVTLLVIISLIVCPDRNALSEYGSIGHRVSLYDLLPLIGESAAHSIKKRLNNSHCKSPLW